MKDSSPNIAADKWKMKFTLKDDKSGPIDVTVNILRVDDSIICVEFNRKQGNQLAFFDFFKQMKKSLNLYNDATFAVWFS